MAFTDDCLKFCIVIINLVCGVLGGLLFSLAVWMRLERDVKDWVRELEMYDYWNGLYILMAAGAIITIISFCGCCGAMVPNTGLLTISVVVIILALILELAGGILILVNGTEASKLTPYLETTMGKLIINSNYNPTANFYLQHVQEKVGCCGSYNYQDYSRNGLPISDSCRDAISGNVYQDGCVKKLAIFIEKRAGWISGISLFVASLQILLVCFTCCYMKNIRSYDDGGYSNRKYIGVPQREKP